MTTVNAGVRSLLTQIQTTTEPDHSRQPPPPSGDFSVATKTLILPRWLHPFQRRTSGRPLLAVVDGLRFYAIATVLLYHVVYNLHATLAAAPQSAFTQAMVRIFRRGAFGVELFFVISGLVLGLPFANAARSGGKSVQLKRYFSRRLTRLEPPFLLSIGVFFLIRTLVVGAPDLWPHLLATSLYSHNWWFQGPSSVSAVTWSLEVEVQFYILAPLLGRIYGVSGRSRRRLIWLLAMLATQGAQFLLPSVGFVHVGQFLCYFLAGMVLAEVMVFDWKGGTEVRWHRAWDVVGILCAIALWWLLELAISWQFIRSLLVLLMYVAIIRGQLLYRFTTQPFVFTFGGMCYTVYLYHNAILRGLFERSPLVSICQAVFGGELAIVMSSVIALCAVAAFSALLFIAIERPCMDPTWFSRLRARSSASRS